MCKAYGRYSLAYLVKQCLSTCPIPQSVLLFQESYQSTSHYFTREFNSLSQAVTHWGCCRPCFLQLEDGIKARPPSIADECERTDNWQKAVCALRDTQVQVSYTSWPKLKAVRERSTISDSWCKNHWQKPAIIHSRQESHYAMGLRSKSQKVRQGQVKQGRHRDGVRPGMMGRHGRGFSVAWFIFWNFTLTTQKN